MTSAELSGSLFGKDKEGVAESGRALKFKLLRTLAKIKRKQRYYSVALENIFKVALALEKVKAEKIDIKWNDGIPTDEREEAELNEILIRSDQMSVEEAVKTRHPEFTPEQVTEEVEKIKGPALGVTPFKNPDEPVLPNMDKAMNKAMNNNEE